MSDRGRVDINMKIPLNFLLGDFFRGSKRHHRRNLVLCTRSSLVGNKKNWTHSLMNELTKIFWYMIRILFYLNVVLSTGCCDIYCLWQFCTSLTLNIYLISVNFLNDY